MQPLHARHAQGISTDHCVIALSPQSFGGRWITNRGSDPKVGNAIVSRYSYLGVHAPPPRASLMGRPSGPGLK